MSEQDAVDKIQFNPTIHQSDDNGDPLRKEDGAIKLKTNWKSVALDRQGRKYNPTVHGEKPELDEEGYLKVRRRKAAKPIGTTNRTQAFIDKYHEEGYTERLVNDDGGRIDMFHSNDWEPVIDKETNQPAKMNVGQARSPNTTAVLMRKPEEWYDEDQREKRRIREEAYKHKMAPNEGKGQYEAKESSPLR